MNEQEKKTFIEEIRSRMNGDVTHDIQILEEEIKKLAGTEHEKELCGELLKIATGMIPQKQQDYMKKMLYIGKRHLNQVYAEVSALMAKHQTDRALALSKQLYEHIVKNFAETDKERFFSFRNLLESNLYHQLYNPTKTMLKAPFDFSLYIGAYAYNLVEAGRAPEAIPVLLEAIRYNPVNPDPRFELAEVYKLTGDNDKLLETILETLPICTSAYAISRCYTNLGFYCVNIKDYDSAVRFYYESLNFADHPAVPAELKHIEQVSRKPLIPPTKEMINAAFAKYQIYHGPGREVVYIARELAKQAEEGQRWKEAVFYLMVVTGLIHDEEAEEHLKQCQQRVAADETV